MRRQLPPLNALRAFEAAGRHQSFSRAADELGVSHSAISRHVRGLEHRLNAQLFRDLPRGVALTQGGAWYLAQLSPAFDMIADASEAFADKPEGMITVNSEPLLAIKWLIPRLQDFQQRYPDIDIRLEASDELVNIERYEADIALRFFLTGQPEPPSALLSDAPIYPYIAPHLMPEPFTEPAQLLQFPLLRDRGGNPWAHWFELAGGVPVEDLPTPGWRMRAMLALESAVAGQGVFLTSAEIVNGDVQAGRLVRCFDIGYREGSYYLLFGEGVLRRRSARLFRDWLLDQSAEFRTGEDS